MRIDQLTNRPAERRVSLKMRLLRFLGEHPHEVFGYRDEDLTRELAAKASAIGFTLWSLCEQGLIDKESVDGKVYFGTTEAIEELRARQRVNEWTAVLERADRFRERMFAKYGHVDVKDLLEETREGL